MGAAEGDAVSLWLQVTIESPERMPVVVRRTIFDRLALDARAGGRLDVTSIPPIELVDLGPDLKGEYLPAQAEHWFTVSGGRLAGDGLRGAVRPPEDPLAFVDQVHLFHLVREAAELELAVPSGVRTFHDAPNVVAFSVTPSKDPTGAMIADFAIDIWHRSYGCLPVRGQPATQMPQVLAGVLSHVAERVLLGNAQPPGKPEPDRPLVSVGAVFDIVRRDGVGIRVLRSGAVPDDLALPPAASATLVATLADGWTVVTPERPVSIGGESRIGWWLVDPATGRTIDQMDDGRGEVDQYAVTLTPGQVAAESALKLRLWKCIVGTADVVVGVLAAVSGAYIGGGTGAGVAAWGASGTGLGGWLLAQCLV